MGRGASVYMFTRYNPKDGAWTDLCDDLLVGKGAADKFEANFPRVQGERYRMVRVLEDYKATTGVRRGKVEQKERETNVEESNGMDGGTGSEREPESRRSDATSVEED